jgi:NAD(P)-dependent dehydrogenase (short-subunit alcohol dehydrogenase family)
MNDALEGKNVFITGATGTSGVGIGVVMAVLEAGGIPIINGRNPARLAEARDRFPEAVIIQGDVAIASDVDRMMRESIERVGTVHHLVNNAGIGLHKAPHLCEESDFDTLIGVDYRGNWLVTRAWLRHVLDDGKRGLNSAAAVNISSVHAQKTIPGYGLYASAKGAVDSLTRALAVHYGRSGIRFNGVAPGYVHADQNMELLRNWTDDPEAWVKEVINEHQATPAPIDPLDVGRVVAFLLSDASKAMTGQTLTVDAGNTALLFPLNFV